MMDRSPRCYTVRSCVEIGPLIPEKKIFEVFFSIYGRGGHAGHVTQMPRTNLRNPTLGGSTQNLALISLVVSEKIFEND